MSKSGKTGLWKNTPPCGARVAGFILQILGIGMEALESIDPVAQKEWAIYPDGVQFVLRAYPQGRPLYMQKISGRWRRTQREIDSPGYIIEFKNLSQAWPVLFGRRSIPESYRRHHVQIQGDLMSILPLVRGISLTVSYLFPSWWLASVPEAHIPLNRSRIAMYGLCIVKAAKGRKK